MRRCFRPARRPAKPFPRALSTHIGRDGRPNKRFHQFHCEVHSLAPANFRVFSHGPVWSGFGSREAGNNSPAPLCSRRSQESHSACMHCSLRQSNWQIALSSGTSSTIWRFTNRHRRLKTFWCRISAPFSGVASLLPVVRLGKSKKLPPRPCYGVRTPTAETQLGHDTQTETSEHQWDH